ncbi:protein of unknown function [Taphrina deformans PYCC 5710]|uniref:Small ribosomal subunit protein uS3m n=1 Tax=Taphrina deformans (strain PYCC 5710 / ATCC 11124 / CBS 356.35 / IMI 108563 / JCM 9778 / NBRC 8474) TaxID=1097556 RepID=R4XBD8_TAPDE|nr:protein of unknown function [Taphrina deformans PYCC 5710]|eukprot:CCG83169.1 protein of unknown function [Taphrina deformans PYCC 5710]
MSYASRKIQAIALKPSKWTPTFSFSKASYNNNLQKDTQAQNLIKHYFQHFLFSTPQVSHSPGKVSFRLYIHANSELKPSKAATTDYNLDKFKTFLSKVYGSRKKVELQVTPLSAPYLNAEIAAQFLVLSSKKKSFATLTNKFMKSTPLGEVVAGVKMQVSGRLGRRKGAGRSSRITRQKGKLGFATYTSRVDAARCEFKNRNGKIGVVVWIRSGEKRLVPGLNSEGRMRTFIQEWRNRKLAEQVNSETSPSLPAPSS